MGEAAVAKTGIFSSLEGLKSKIEDSNTEPKNPEPDKIAEFTVTPPISTKVKLEQICTMLDEVRLTMTESAGQGFLFNAQYQIQAFLNRLR